MMRVDGSMLVGGEGRKWLSFSARGKATIAALLLKVSDIWDEILYRGLNGAHCRGMNDMKASGAI